MTIMQQIIDEYSFEVVYNLQLFFLKPPKALYARELLLNFYLLVDI